MQNKIVFIVGPTAVGKSALAFALAKHLKTSIVSCDAMQVYTEVNIACDKPSQEMRSQIPHYCVDIASVKEAFNVAQYAKEANVAITAIIAQGKTPLVVGGSGMYLNVLLDGIFDEQFKDENLREELLKRAQDQGSAALYQELQEKDPTAAAKIHPNDVKRLVRALEVSILAGKPMSVLQQDRKGLWGQYDIKIFGLTRKRALLYQRVEERIDWMFGHGLIDEVKSISQLPLSKTAETMIGVPEVQGYLNGVYDLEQAKYLMKRNTRRYVKRQLTWFRRDKRITWIDINTEQTVENVSEKILKFYN